MNFLSDMCGHISMSNCLVFASEPPRRLTRNKSVGEKRIAVHVAANEHISIQNANALRPDVHRGGNHRGMGFSESLTPYEEVEETVRRSIRRDLGVGPGRELTVLSYELKRSEGNFSENAIVVCGGGLLNSYYRVSAIHRTLSSPLSRRRRWRNRFVTYSNVDGSGGMVTFTELFSE